VQKVDHCREDFSKRFDLCESKFESTDKRLEILWGEVVALKSRLPEKARGNRGRLV